MDYRNTENFYNLNVRNGIIAMHGMFYAFSNFYLPLPILSTIYSTGPIFVFILDYYINRITINRSQFYGIIFGIVGVIFTVNGGIFINYFD
jgi:drug/metabolite transporter (DMT)-like permease